jgi:hypothetical protein
VLVPIVAVALTLALPPPVAAATLTLEPTQGAPTSSVTAFGSEYPADSEIRILWDGVAIQAPAFSAESRFRIVFRVPGDATRGPHDVTACVKGAGPNGCEEPRVVATFTVVFPGDPTPAPTATPVPSPTPIPPSPSFPVALATPTPEAPPLVVVTPKPTPPNQEGTPQDVFPDLWIKAIEVTQGIQDLQNRMPLVAGRRTYARVYVGVIGEQSWPNTYGALEARRDGQQIGWIWPENGPISAQVGAGSRVQVDDTLNFRLPEAWLEGEVTLTAFVYSYDVDTVFANEPEWENNILPETVAFHPAEPLSVHLAPLHLHRSFHPDDVERIYTSDLGADLLPPGGSATMRIVRGLYRYQPLAQVNVDLLTTPITPLNHEDGQEFAMGDCQTVLLEWFEDGHLELTDWQLLMEAPETIEPVVGTSMEADRPTLAILDRTYQIDFWAVTASGRVAVYGSSSGEGPQPLPGTPVFVDGCKPNPSTAAEPNQTLALYRAFYDWDGEEDLFVGMVDPSLPTQFGGFSTSGTDSVWVRMNDTLGSTYPWYHSGAETLAHEAGHAAGLKHVPCRDEDDDGVADEEQGGAIDPSHPDALSFPTCTLAVVDPEGYYGFDVYWTLWNLPGPTVISNDPAQAAPNNAWPLMSYQNPGWPDPYHYCRLLAFYGVPCDPTDLGLAWSEPDAPAGGPLTSPPDPAASELPPDIGLISMRGSFDPTTGIGTLEGSFLIPNPTATALRRYAGQYVVDEARHPADLVVLDAAGSELYRIPIVDQELTHDADSRLEFELLVPAPPEATTFQIISVDNDVARVDVSANAPLVAWEPVTLEPDIEDRIKVRLLWTATDDDGDALTYTLLYAPDGEHWQVIAAGLTELGYEVDLDSLSGGEAPVFQVIAFDGARGATAVSEPIDPIPGLRPKVVLGIRTPIAYASGTPVLLTASAFDAEDRAVAGDSIAWSSSIDGALGTGSELLVGDLTAGSHTITATVTDSDGLNDSQSTQLLIDGSLVQQPADPAVESDVSTIFVAVAGGQDPGAAIAEPPAPPSSTLPLLLAAAALAVVGAGLFWVRSRRIAAGARRRAEPGAWKRR